MAKRILFGILAGAMVFMLLAAPGFASSSSYDSSHPESLNDIDLSAIGAILVEASTGMVVYEKNADARLYPASTTKILTAYLAVLLGDMEQTVTATPTSLSVEADSSKIPLSVGEEVNFKDLIYATMIRSGNDGANLIAETISGNIDGFVDLMNQYVASMGLVNTHFANPNGLHNENHFTSARDLAAITREAMQDPLFRDIVSKTEYAFPKTNLNRSRLLTSRLSEFIGNPESSSYYSYATGIKTGYTSAAGHCFVGSAIKDGVEFISVVLHCDGSNYNYCWRDTRRLMEYGFSQYVSVSVPELYAMQPKVLEISKFDLEDPELGKLELQLNKLNASDQDKIVTLRSRLDYLVSNFNDLVTIEYVHEPVAPIDAGDVMATLTYYPDAGEPIEYELVASRSISRRVLDVPELDVIIRDTENDPNPFPRFTAEIAVFVIFSAAVFYALVRIVRHLLGYRSKRSDNKPVEPAGRYYR